MLPLKLRVLPGMLIITGMNSGIKVFSNNNGRIFLGDALEILSGIPDESVDLVFVDPPYNIGKNFAGRKDKWKTDDE